MRCRGAIVAFMALTLAPSALLADRTLPEAHSWRDAINSHEVRALGLVAAVRDNPGSSDAEFDLRTPNGLLTFRFDPKRQPGIWSALEIGKRVQVWYDPEVYPKDAALQSATSIKPETNASKKS